MLLKCLLTRCSIGYKGENGKRGETGQQLSGLSELPSPTRGVSSCSASSPLRQYSGQECRARYNHEELSDKGRQVLFGEEEKKKKKTRYVEEKLDSPKMSLAKRQRRT